MSQGWRALRLAEGRDLPTRTFYAREKKKYGLRSAYQPQQGYPVAGNVLVADMDGKGYAAVRFEEELVRAVGKALPMGVGPANPAYLKVLHVHRKDAWRVYAFYFDSSHGVLLWETKGKPDWLKRVRRK